MASARQTQQALIAAEVRREKAARRAAADAFHAWFHHQLDHTEVTQATRDAIEVYLDVKENG